MARIRTSSLEIKQPITGWLWIAADADAASRPSELPAEGWKLAIVPGTVGAILREQGEFSRETAETLDLKDHWYRATLDAPLKGRLHFEGLATICEIFIDGEQCAESRSMFEPLDLDVDLAAGTEIALCFRALVPKLAAAPRRSRWRPGMIQPNGLRFFRTSALGSMPGWCPPGRPIGPWRPIERISHIGAPLVDAVNVRTNYEDGVASLSVSVKLAPVTQAADAAIRCGETSAPLMLEEGHFTGHLIKPDARPWFPHTHGEQVLYPLKLVIGDAELDLGPVGFRSLAIDRGTDGKGFGLIVNGVPVFCRGACWSSPDVVGLPGDRAAYEPWLRQARDAGMNMLRVPGTTAYESDEFFALCDELGLMVWQETMLANFDYPQGNADFRSAIEAETIALLDRTQTSPSLVVLCGGSEVFQQAAMLGAPPEAWSGPVFDEVLPAIIAAKRPDLAYVPNSPSGGPLPFVANEGVTHYYGAGAYQRPLEDARRAEVRFAAECLAFANLPEETSLKAAGLHLDHEDWKRGVPRDAGVDWDFEDTRDHYLEHLYGLRAAQLRAEDPERYLALSRAAVAEVMEEIFAEWRRPASPTRGAMVLMLQDLQPGAGWGVIASDGEAKSAWHALKRAFRPVQVAITDEGVNGLALHVTNERPAPLEAELRLTCWRDGATPVVQASRAIQLSAHDAVTISAFDLIGRFFDITYAYRFGPPGHDVTSVTLVNAATGAQLAEAFHFPLGRGHARSERGLLAELERDGQGWRLALSTERFAQSIEIVDKSWRPAENWFHLTPGTVKRVALSRRFDGASDTPSGEVRAVNAREKARYRWNEARAEIRGDFGAGRNQSSNIAVHHPIREAQPSLLPPRARPESVGSLS